MTNNVQIEDTGERMIPEFNKGSLIYAEHITRYKATQQLVDKKIVLDIASGSGYGTKILAEKASKVFGVDVDTKSVAYSKSKFPADNIEYLVGDGINIPLNDSSIDIVVSFETIEHIENYTKFISEVIRVLKPDGLLIISTPNDIEFAEGNHFHVHEFTEKELTGLLKEHFKYIDFYYQATWKNVAIGKEDIFTKDEYKYNTDVVNLAPLNKDQYLYFYFLCSNRKIKEEITSISATGEHYSERSMVNNFNATKHELERRENNIKELERIVEIKEKARADTENNLNIILNELDAIKNSKAYKIANKAATTTHSIKRTVKGKK